MQRVARLMSWGQFGQRLTIGGLLWKNNGEYPSHPRSALPLDPLRAGLFFLPVECWVPSDTGWAGKWEGGRVSGWAGKAEGGGIGQKCRNVRGMHVRYPYSSGQFRRIDAQAA